MKPIFICYKRCSTCRDAMKFLDNNNIAYDYRDIMSDNPNANELRKWIGQSEFPIKKFFNTRGVLYREMNLKDKLDDLSDEEAIELLSTDGRLLKRPLLISQEGIFVGYHKELYETLIP
ncbi:arsenate reductase family protein [Erysipelothrix urinaevulpis]|uniref:arsenate reductase family protein n=1 Tax=Erysipelothrix urinaevulpis TaxID=2683717 RepID=UPI001358F2CA|nr:arsenate reductase family protein [Erysipelothrix urinaevulpis]